MADADDYIIKDQNGKAISKELEGDTSVYFMSPKVTPHMERSNWDKNFVVSCSTGVCASGGSLSVGSEGVGKLPLFTFASTCVTACRFKQ